MTLPLGFLMKDVLFLVASLLRQDLARAALEIIRSRATLTIQTVRATEL
jgi:hypothetical protein